VATSAVPCYELCFNHKLSTKCKGRKRACHRLLYEIGSFWSVTLSVNLKSKLKVSDTGKYRCPHRGRRYTCATEGVLNLVATGSETAGLIRRRRRRAPIGCGLCSCQSACTLPPPASDQSVILHGIDCRCGLGRWGGMPVGGLDESSSGGCAVLPTTNRFYYRPVQSSLKTGLHAR